MIREACYACRGDVDAEYDEDGTPQVYQHAPSPLDQLATWLEKQTRNHPGALAVNPYTVSIYHYTRYDEGDRNQYRVAIEKHDDHYEQAGGDTIQQAAAKLLDQLKDKP